MIMLCRQSWEGSSLSWEKNGNFSVIFLYQLHLIFAGGLVSTRVKTCPITMMCNSTYKITITMSVVLEVRALILLLLHYGVVQPWSCPGFQAKLGRLIPFIGANQSFEGDPPVSIAPHDYRRTHHCGGKDRSHDIDVHHQVRNNNICC